MTSPIYIVVVALGACAVLPAMVRIGRSSAGSAWGTAAGVVFYLALAALVAVPASWIPELAATAGEHGFRLGSGAIATVDLRAGVSEAVVLLLINLVALFSAITLRRWLSRGGSGGYVAVLATLVGADGLVLARDLLSACAFLVILSLGTWALVADDRTEFRHTVRLRPSNRGRDRSGDGTDYPVTAALSVVLFIAGAALLFRLTGTLQLSELSRSWPDATGNGGVAALDAVLVAPFFVVASLFLRLQPFPTNAWALSSSERSHAGVAALVATANTTAALMVIYRLLPMLPPGTTEVMGWAGMLCFVVSNALGLARISARRTLAHNTAAQAGLIAAVFAIAARDASAGFYLFIVAGGLIATHVLARAGLFWLAGETDETTGGTALARDRDRRVVRPLAGVAAVLLGLAVVGLPPFPGFWARWQVVNTLLASGRVAMLVLVLVGSLFETLYVLRWVGRLIAVPDDAARPAVRTPIGTAVGVSVLTVLLGAAGVFIGWTLGLNTRLIWAPFFFAAVMLLLEWLPSRVKALIAFAAVGGYSALVYPLVSGVGLVFGAIFAAGAVVALVASLGLSDTPVGFHSAFVLAATSLIGLVVATEPIAFFLLWELLVVGSYLLVARGNGTDAPSAARRHLGFAVGAALLILPGLMVASHARFTAGEESISVPRLYGADAYVRLPVVGASLTVAADGSLRPAEERSGEDPSRELGRWSRGFRSPARRTTFALLALGLLVWAGAVPAHVWLPGSYAATDGASTAFLASALSKAAILGLIVLTVMVGRPTFREGGVSMNAALGWIGTFTALFGALTAMFQENVKKILAYASLSQVGYIVVGVSLATHLGWLAGIYEAAHHLLYHSLLIVAMSALIARAGTTSLRGLGGLARRMPFTSACVVVGAVALSGLPPLSGFGGRWLLVSALVENGAYMRAGLVLLASVAALLYLARMVGAVVARGAEQADEGVREAPVPMLIAQGILLAALVSIGIYPSLLVEPTIGAIDPYLGAQVDLRGNAAVRFLDYWNGSAIAWALTALVVGATVVLVMRRGGPFGPTHGRGELRARFARNYRRALGFLASPGIDRAWEYAVRGAAATSLAMNRVYEGKGWASTLRAAALVIVLWLAAGIVG